MFMQYSGIVYKLAELWVRDNEIGFQLQPRILFTFILIFHSVTLGKNAKHTEEGKLHSLPPLKKKKKSIPVCVFQENVLGWKISTYFLYNINLSLTFLP